MVKWQNVIYQLPDQITSNVTQLIQNLGIALHQFMAVMKIGFKSNRSESLEYRSHKTVDRIEIVRRDRLINRLKSP